MLFRNLKKYKSDEIKVGMRVNTYQLSEIYNTYIILSEVKLEEDDLGICAFSGVIDSITKEWIPLRKRNSTIVYNEPFDGGEYCYHE